ncbi:hypothetical protein C0991_003651, partial [Blastosporella zonata]
MQVAIVVEDQMGKEDIERDKSANHPPDSIVPQLSGTKALDRKKRDRESEVQSESTGDKYVDEEERPQDLDNDEDDAVDEVDSEAIDILTTKWKKKQTTQCSDIQAAQTFKAVSGMPVVPFKAQQTVIPSAPKKRKTNSPTLSGLAPNWENAQSCNILTTSVSSGVLTGADNSMVQYGGFTSDGDTDAVEHPLEVCHSPQPVPTTRKEARGGAKKWTLSHLPNGTIKLFQDAVVPFACIKAGTKAPWAGLTTGDIQAIVDKVFGEDEHLVTENDVWCGLLFKDNVDEFDTKDAITNLVDTLLIWREWVNGKKK